MHMIIIGAVGDVGRRIVTEALSRGHTVTGVVRSEAQFDRLPDAVTPRAVDVSNPLETARAIQGHDLVISAVRPPDGQEEVLVALTRCVLDGAQAAGVRALIVGGASPLKLPDGQGATVLSAPGFLPDAVVPIARACHAQYELTLAKTRVDWTYLSPAALLEPGERTGRYRLGTDTLVVDDNGLSCISMEDFAVAMLDEAEAAKHIRTPFTVGY